MKELFILLSPVFWSIRNDIIRPSRSFYRKAFLYTATSSVFLVVVTRLLGIGMSKLQHLSPDVFQVLLIKAYSLVFIIVFFVQIINGAALSLNTYYQSRDLEVLLISPVNRTSLFLSRLVETHIKASWMLIIFGIPLLVSSGLLYHTSVPYYFYALVLFIAFSVVPVNIGAGVTIFLASIVRIGRMKSFVLSTGIIAVVLLVTLLRIFRPERFVNPELFANLTLFINEMKTPSFILLPNRWLSEAVFSFLGETWNSNTFMFIALLFLTAYITTFFLYLVFTNYHARGWVQLQEGGILRKKEVSHNPLVAVSEKFIQWITRRLDAGSRVLIIKDLFCQVRDVKNIHHILILLSLVIIYLFSVAALPLNWEGYTEQLKYVISFFNLGLILVIIASLCSRIVYPALVSEGTSLWIVKTSPLTPKRHIMTKFFFFFVPLCILGQFLTVFSSLSIGIEKAFILLKIATTALLSFSLVGMAISFGVSDIKRGAIASQGQARTGNTAHMLVSILLILFTLGLEAIPFFLYFLKEAKQGVLTQMAWAMMGGVVAAVFILNVSATAFSIRKSIKDIDTLEVN